MAGSLVFGAGRSNATVINENFTNNPALAGWQVFGDTNLFQWDSTNRLLDVTWDSSQTNSFFYHSLGGVYSKTNDFMVSFDFRLNDIAIGTTANKPLTFELAFGLINTGEATGGNFYRGTGYFPDIVEFDYFPNDINDYGATISTLMISSQTNYSAGGFTEPLALTTNTLYHVVMVYTAANQTLHTVMTADGAPFGPIEDAYLGSWFDDYQVDAVSINSYSDDGQDPSYAGSIRAHGTVSHMLFASPLPVTHIQVLDAAPGRVQFEGTTNWIYTLERTADFQSWQDVSQPVPGVAGAITLSDTNPPPGKAFYRVRADLP